MRRTIAIGALAAVLLLAGCGSSGAGTDDSAPPASSDSGGTGYGTESAAPDDTSASDLKLAETSLGEVVVTGSGMTAYMFDNDTQGADTSSCTGACLQNWPPIIAGGDAPVGDGITGELGTIETADGQQQVTLNGWPLYLFAGDTAAGDVNGQAVQDVWWVVDAAGEKLGG